MEKSKDIHIEQVIYKEAPTKPGSLAIDEEALAKSIHRTVLDYAGAAKKTDQGDRPCTKARFLDYANI